MKLPVARTVILLDSSIAVSAIVNEEVQISGLKYYIFLSKYICLYFFNRNYNIFGYSRLEPYFCNTLTVTWQTLI